MVQPDVTFTVSQNGATPGGYSYSVTGEDDFENERNYMVAFLFHQPNPSPVPDPTPTQLQQQINNFTK